VSAERNRLFSMLQRVMQWSNEWCYWYFIFSRHPFHEIDKVNTLLKFRLSYSKTGKWYVNENSLWTRSLLCRVKGSIRIKCLQLGVWMPISKFSSHFLCYGWDKLCVPHVCIKLYECVLCCTCTACNRTLHLQKCSVKTLWSCVKEIKMQQITRTMHAVPSVCTQHCWM
jgi:hypothetical protein